MKRAPFRKLITATVLALGSLTAGSPASASTVYCDGTGTTATVCHGVVFNGTIYDVTWGLGNYPTGPIPPFVYADLPDAPLTMIAAINTALNDGSFQSIQYATSSTPATALFYYLPYAIYPGASGDNVHTLEGVFDNKSTDILAVNQTGPANSWYTNPDTGLDTTNPYKFSYPETAESPLIGQNDLPTVYLTATGTVPVPASLPLLLSGIGFMGWLARRRRPGC